MSQYKKLALQVNSKYRMFGEFTFQVFLQKPYNLI